MNILIAYATKNGCTKKCAKLLAEKLHKKVDLVNLKKQKTIDLAKYEIVILGGSIRMGMINGSVKRFCKNNIEVLLNKKVGLFICCAAKEEETQPYFVKAFPSELLEKAFSKECFGGEMIIEDLKGFDKFIAKMVSKSTEAQKQPKPKVLTENIVKMAQEINDIK